MFCERTARNKTWGHFCWAGELKNYFHEMRIDFLHPPLYISVILWYNNLAKQTEYSQHERYHFPQRIVIPFFDHNHF